MNATSYQLYDLIIQSDFEIPNLRPAKILSEQPADVFISKQKIKPLFDEITFQEEWDDLKLKIGVLDNQIVTYLDLVNAAQFWIVDGRFIQVEPYPHGQKMDIQSYLLGIAATNLLFQRKMFVLHGASIVKDNQGFIVVGESGAGKTTTVAALAMRGFPILSEDITVVKMKDGVPHLLASNPYLKLMPNSIDFLGLDQSTMPPLYSDYEKWAYILDKEWQFESVPLSRVCLLRLEENSDNLEVKDLEPFNEKLGNLVDNIHYLNFFMGYDLDEAYTDLAIHLAENIPFSIVSRPQGKNTIKEIGDLFLHEFAQQKTVELT